MLKNFGTMNGWEGRLINKRTGEVVIVAETDLIAGETYIWARNTEETITLAGILKKQEMKKEATQMSVKKDTSIHREVEKTVSVAQIKKPSLTERVLEKAEELGIDFNTYVHTIASAESNHRHKIDNVEKGKERKVASSKWAYGKYQFTDETLQTYGITTQEERLSFL